MPNANHKPGDVIWEHEGGGLLGLPKARKVFLRKDKRGRVYTREEVLRTCSLCCLESWESPNLRLSDWHLSYMGFGVTVAYCPSCKELGEEMDVTLRIIVEREVADVAAMFRNQFARRLRRQ